LSHHACLFFLQCSPNHRHLHSFPTRRSSDLPPPPARVEVRDNKIEIREKIQFDHAKATIKEESHDLLNEIVDVIKKNPHIKKISDRKSTRLNSSHVKISYAVFCLKKKKKKTQ